MKVLITGGMGVIGAETSRKFVLEGHRPVIFARHRDERLIADILDEVDIELGDLLDMPRLLQVIKTRNVTHIVHTAAFVSAVSQANPALSVQVNVMGMVNVLEAARVLDVKRVVYPSAKGVCGAAKGAYGARLSTILRAACRSIFLRAATSRMTSFTTRIPHWGFILRP